MVKREIHGMRIGICDDEIMILELLKALIEECLEELGISGQVVSFRSGEEVIDEAENLDVLFLDIEMPQMDGIELGHKLRKKAVDCKIIMATSRTERFKEVFKINAYDFVTKPFDKEEVKEVLERVYRNFLKMETIEVYKERTKCEIYLKNIKYIKAVDSYIELTVKNGKYRKDTSLTQLEGVLDQRFFFRINRTYLINLAWIDEYSNGTICIDGMKLKVSVRNRKEFERRYIEYDVNYR